MAKDAQSRPSQSELAQDGLEHAGSAQSEPAQDGLEQAGSARAGAAQSEPPRGGLAHDEPAQAGAARGRLAQAGAARSRGPRFQPVQTVRAYQRIVEQIEDALVRGDLSPGQRLPSERELVTQFAVSRSTVREALRVLESNGVVRSRPGDPNGPEILPFSQGPLRKQMTRLARVDELTLSELIAFRMIMDGAAIQLASRLRTDEQLAEMEETLVAMRTAIDVDFAAFSEADVAFHEAVARVSRNSLLQTCNEVVRGVVLSLISDKIAHATNSRALMLESLQHHTEVVDAIRAGNGHAAARLARQTLYTYYAPYVPTPDRATLRALIDD